MAATKTRSRAAQPLMRKVAEQRPLVAELGEVTTHYVMSDHAIERAQERGIGVFEVYSAIVEPDRIDPDTDQVEGRVFVRGDICVVTGPSKFGDQFTIKTVIDRFQDERPSPRKPLDPMKAGVMSRTKQANPQVLDEAWAIVAHDEEDYRKITITPALAEKLLALNTHNRPIRKRDVEEWKRKMSTGEYRPTHQGIAIDSNGVLQDGQHRLTAIVELELEQTAWVAVGLPPEYFTIVDVGRNRNYSDVLALSGELNTVSLGSIVRMVWLYLNYDGPPRGGVMKVTNAMVMEAFNADAGRFREAVRVGDDVKRSGFGLTRVAAGAGWYLIRRVNTPAKVNEFFEGIISGVEIPAGDPRLILGRKLRNDNRRNWGFEHLALLIKCWNMWATGAENVKVIMWRKDEKMPQVAKAER